MNKSIKLQTFRSVIQPWQFAAMLVAIFILCGNPPARAASGTWTNAPADATWTNILNWNGQVVPGTINNTANNGVDTGSIVTFTNPIPGSLIGSASNPIIPDDATVVNGKARMMGQLNFDGPDCGAYVFYSPSAFQPRTATQPETGVISLCDPSGAGANGSFIGASVVNPQTFLIPVQIRLPSSTSGQYGFTNNAISSNATYYFSQLWLYPDATGRGVIFVFSGSNTGTNTVAYLSQSANQTGSPSGIRKEGTGRWILPGTNNFAAGSSMSINDGTLEIQNEAGFGASTTVSVISNGVLRLDGVSLISTAGGSSITTVLLKKGGTLLMSGSGANNIKLDTAVATSATIATANSGDVLTVSTNSGGAADTVLHVAGPGTVVLATNITYVGSWSLDSGTIQLENSAGLGAGSLLNIGAGVTFDLSSLGAISWNPGTAAIGGSGTGSAIGSTAATISADTGAVIDLATGAKTISLTFAPTAFTGDTTHPALYLSQGTLSLGGNPINVNNTSGTPLGIGTYLLIQQASGSITSGGGYVVNVTGSGIAGGTLGSIQVVGGNVNLVIAPYTSKNLTWKGGNPDSTWDNGSTANWLDGVTPSIFNPSDIVTFDSTGSANPTVNLSGTLLPGSVTVDTSANDYTFSGSGRIAGSTSLTKISSGTLLVQTVNTYSGGTVVSNGTLRVGIDDALPNTGSSGVTVLNPAVLDLNNFSNVIGSLAGDGTVDNLGGGASTLIVGDNNSSATFSGVIQNTSGTLGLTKSGTGIETLTVANTYTGPTIINNGTLRVGNINSLASSPLTINIGTLDLRSSLILSNLNGAFGTTIANNSSATTNTLIISGAATNVSSVIADGTGGGGVAVFVQSGTLQLNGANTYSGGTIVAGGATLAIGVDNGNKVSSSAGTGGIIASNGATISVPTAVSTSAGVPNTITTVDGATVTFNSGEVADAFDGQFIGGPTTTNVFTGNMTIGGATSFSNFLGTVVMTAANPNGIRFFTPVGGGQNTTFDLEGGDIFTRDADTVILGALQGNGSITGPSVTASSTYLIGGKGVDTVFSGTINGSNNIVKVGSGMLTLDGGGMITNVTSPDGFTEVTNLTVVSLAYSGATTISNGVLKLVVPIVLTNSFNGAPPTPITLAGDTAVLDASDMGYYSNEFDFDGVMVTNILFFTNGILEIVSSQLLNGIGTVNGDLQADAGSILNPGNTTAFVDANNNLVLTNSTDTGVLNITGAASILGAVNMRLNLTNAVNADEIAAGSFSIDPGATLTIANVGPENAATFQLFNHPVNFATVVLPTLSGTNSWINNLSTDGSITLIAPTFVPPVNTTPTNIVATVTGAAGNQTLNLSWPADHTGWQLQTQTNPLDVGLGTNWVDVAGSALTNQVAIPINPTNGTVFFRMVITNN